MHYLRIDTIKKWLGCVLICVCRVDDANSVFPNERKFRRRMAIVHIHNVPFLLKLAAQSGNAFIRQRIRCNFESVQLFMTFDDLADEVFVKVRYKLHLYFLQIFQQCQKSGRDIHGSSSCLDAQALQIAMFRQELRPLKTIDRIKVISFQAFQLIE